MKNIDYRLEVKKSIVLVSSLAFTPLKYVANSIVEQFITLPSGIVSALLWALFITFWVLPILKHVHITKDALAIICFIGLSWSLSLYANSDYHREWFSMFIKIFIRCLPYYIIARNIRDFNLLNRILKKTAYFITFCILIVVGLKILNGTMERYDMHLAYLTLPAAILSLAFLRTGFEWRLLFNFCLSVIIIIMMGTRGPLVCVALCMIFCLIEKILCKSVPALLLVLFLVMSSFLVMIYFNEVLDLIYNVAKKLGLSVRIIETIQEGSFFSSTGRYKIYDATLQLISNHPITGTGIIADRLNIALIYQGNNIDFLGSYPHLIFLEFILQFGIIIGGILSFFLIVLICKCLFISNHSAYYLSFVTFLFVGLIPLFLSNSYLQSESFYVFLGFTISGIKNNSVQRKKYNW